MKYRVKQVGLWFYPQYKWLCFWFNIREGEIGLHGYVRRISLEAAKFEISRYKKSLIKKVKVTNIWEIE